MNKLLCFCHLHNWQYKKERQTSTLLPEGFNLRFRECKWCNRKEYYNLDILTIETLTSLLKR